MLAPISAGTHFLRTNGTFRGWDSNIGPGQRRANLFFLHHDISRCHERPEASRRRRRLVALWAADYVVHFAFDILRSNFHKYQTGYRPDDTGEERQGSFLGLDFLRCLHYMRYRKSTIQLWALLMDTEQATEKTKPSASTVAANAAFGISGGAAVGAVVGSIIMPGAGSAVGALIGGLIGVAGERFYDREQRSKSQG